MQDTQFTFFTLNLEFRINRNMQGIITAYVTK